MSGLHEIKKKAKLSIDEMYDFQPVGKLDNQKDGNPEIIPVNQPEKIHLQNNPDSHPTGNPSFQELVQPHSYKVGQTITHQSGKLETNPEIKQEPQNIRQTAVYPTTKQQIQKIPTYKMTFNLTEDIYKAFNDLYANRMLQGRKTEKSEMICEAIQWLIKMEEEQTQ